MVAIVTDNASAPKLGREKLIEEPGYKHLVELRQDNILFDK